MNNSDKNDWLWIAAISLTLAVIIGSIQTSDYQADLVMREHYCEMVKSKLWPDYKHIYKTECLKKSARLP